MEKYKLTRNPYTGEISDYVMKISDGSIVHKTLNEEYLKWLEEGNTPLPAENT